MLRPQAVAHSLRRLTYNPYGWLAGLSRGLGLLTAYDGLRRLATAYRNTIQKVATKKLDSHVSLSQN